MMKDEKKRRRGVKGFLWEYRILLFVMLAPIAVFCPGCACVDITGVESGGITGVAPDAIKGVEADGIKGVEADGIKGVEENGVNVANTPGAVKGVDVQPGAVKGVDVQPGAVEGTVESGAVTGVDADVTDSGNGNQASSTISDSGNGNDANAEAKADTQVTATVTEEEKTEVGTSKSEVDEREDDGPPTTAKKVAATLEALSEQLRNL